MTDVTRNLLFKLKADPAATAQLKSSADAVLQRFTALDTVAKKLRSTADVLSQEWDAVGSASKSAAVSMNQFNDALRGAQVNQMTDDMESLRQETLRYNEALDEAAKSEKKLGATGTGGTAGGGFNRSVSAVGRLGSNFGLGEPFMIADDIMDVASSMGELSTTTVLTGGALTAASIAGIGLNAILKDYQEQAQKARQATHDYIMSQLEFNQFISTARREDVETQLQSKIKDAQAQQATIDQLKADLKSIEDQRTQIREALGGSVVTEALIDSIAAAINVGQANNYGIEPLSESAQAIVSKGQAQKDVEDLTTSIQKTQDEIRKLQNALDSTSLAAVEATFAVGDAFSGAGNILTSVADAINNKIAERNKQFLSAAVDTTESVVERAVQMLQLKTEYDAETAQIEEDRLEKTTSQQLDFEKKQAQNLTQHYADLASLDEKYYADQGRLLENLSKVQSDSDEAVTKAVQTSNREAEKAAREHQRKMLDIQRDMNDGLDQAVEDRDVMAAIKAVRAAKRQAEDEQANYDEQKQQRDESLAIQIEDLKIERDEKIKSAQKALDDLRDSHNKERQSRIAAFNTKQNEERQQYQTELNEQRAAWSKQDAERQAQYSDQMNKLSGYRLGEQTAAAQHYSTMAGITSKGMETVRGGFKAGLDNLVADVKEALVGKTDIGTRGTVGGGSSTGTTYGGKGSFAGGGYPPVGEWVRTGENGPEWARFLSPARIYSASESRAMGGQNININVPISGGATEADAARIKAVFQQEIIPEIVRATRQARPVQGVG